MSDAREDPRLSEAHAMPIADLAEQLAIPGLKRLGREMTGPCPRCGGRDRFSINVDRNVYNCRSCGGGDQIGLVRLVNDCSFKDALAYIAGDTSLSIDPGEQRRRQEKYEADKTRRENAAARRRAAAVDSAREIWNGCQGAACTMVADYLALRGMPASLTTQIPSALRFHPALPYMVPGGAREWIEIHRGPAMVAAVVSPRGEVTAVHRTWLDLSRPKGKATLEYEGTPMPAKKVWGSKKGCAIRLSHETGDRFTTLVMGEGIETTLTAMVADAYPDAAYWSGVDLGNMSGIRTKGKGLKFAGIPDMTDDRAFVPPPWIGRLIFIQDGDSEPRLTRAQLLSGLRRARAKNPRLIIQIVHAGKGRDLNDVLMDGGEDGLQE